MMNIDVLGGVEATISAALVVSALGVVMGRDLAGRVKVAFVLVGWFVLIVILAATGALGNDHGIGTPGLGCECLRCAEHSMLRRWRYWLRFRPCGFWE